MVKSLRFRRRRPRPTELRFRFLIPRGRVSARSRSGAMESGESPVTRRSSESLERRYAAASSSKADRRARAHAQLARGRGEMPPCRSAVFEKFTQISKPRDFASGGLGIWLSIVERLVQMHGGTVQALSAGLGMGSEFVVRLPRAAPAETVAIPRAPDPRPQADHRQRFVVADDNVDSAES